MKKILLLITLFILIPAIPAIAAEDLSKPLFNLKSVSCIDQEGYTAFSLIIPSDWKFKGNVIWSDKNSDIPASISMKTSNPASSQALELFPASRFEYSDDPDIENSPDNKTKNKKIQFLAPISASEYLESYVIPNNRPNSQIIETVDLPELARFIEDSLGSGTIPDGSSRTIDAAMSLIEYTEKNLTIKEEIFTVIEKIDTPVQTMNGIVTNISWKADYQFAFKAQAEQFEDLRGLFETIVLSIFINPDNEKFADSYEQLHKIYSGISDEFSMYTIHVESFIDPLSNMIIWFPTGYQSAWVNESGEYVLSRNPDYNPNQNAKVKWVELNRN